MARATDTPEITPFTTREEDGTFKLPAGQITVTRDEMKYLKEMSWGPDAYRIACVGSLETGPCTEVMVFEKHPADWPNHPGEPGDVRVAIECPRCGTKQFTDGATEVDFVKALHAKVYADVMAEVAARMSLDPAQITHVSAQESGQGGDVGTAG